MALPEQITTRERDKFEEVNSLVHVRTKALSTSLGQSGILTTYAASVAAGGASVPPVAGNNILEFLVRCASDQPGTRRLEYSLDGGTVWFVFKPGESDSGSIPLGSTITQIMIRSGTASTVNYEIALTREA